MSSNFTQMSNIPDLFQVIASSQDNLLTSLNCIRVGIIQEFYPEDLIIKVLLANKKLLGLNPDGSQILTDYPPVYAKVCFCSPYITYPIAKDMECLLLFSDREIESWFTNGDINPLSYTRMHDKSDAIAILGIRSLPHMISILADCLHLFYGQSGIQIQDSQVDISSSAINLNGTTSTPHIDVGDGASGNLVDSQGKVLATVTNGIITSIS